LEENDDPRRAELLRLHRRLIGTCCEPDAHPERAEWQARMMELLFAGVVPCVPQHTLELPGDVPLVGSFVPPGTFLMGGTEYDNEKPVHRVTLTSGWFMGARPVTQAQWTAVMGTESSRFKGPNKPVEQVSWDECQEFCTKLTAHLGGRSAVRLPTEAEWECACRAGTTTHYHFGDVLNTELANYNGALTWKGSPTGRNRKTTTNVGTFPANLWGLYDMHGNVSEWCADRYALYPVGTQQNNAEESDDSDRVLRGGSWRSSPRRCRAAARGRNAASRSEKGFRVCFRPD
jgi:formylglycine-generating enzyme required for sulfatase activity